MAAIPHSDPEASMTMLHWLWKTKRNPACGAGDPLPAAGAPQAPAGPLTLAEVYEAAARPAPGIALVRDCGYAAVTVRELEL
ncbi:MAG: hypothetical protein HUK26_06430, partial [Duodenibacillus sp.]|nr:hypothetical protein [Duodenibacillus sp.]